MLKCSLEGARNLELQMQFRRKTFFQIIRKFISRSLDNSFQTFPPRWEAALQRTRRCPASQKNVSGMGGDHQVSKSRITVTTGLSVAAQLTQKGLAWTRQYSPPLCNGSASSLPIVFTRVQQAVIEHRFPFLVWPAHCLVMVQHIHLNPALANDIYAKQSAFYLQALCICFIFVFFKTPNQISESHVQLCSCSTRIIHATLQVTCLLHTDSFA